ncbi:response regulator [Aridibaculum aurantiacum]|uniref:response regulator n=1 Tax=Aridibaculum aurantiacum TaxID=2810307 RepID=UPI001A969E98|nr:response regulator [Aridibaculum aurantiacum]
METPFRILIADDDADDIQLTKECFVENEFPIDVNDVQDGQLLLEHLKKLVLQHERDQLPQLILLDLNMPRKTGLEALRELKADTQLCRIPVIIFSTSKAQRDIDKAYELGASCFVNKPNTLEEWCDKMGKLGKFWIDCVKVAV